MVKQSNNLLGLSQVNLIISDNFMYIEYKSSYKYFLDAKTRKLLNKVKFKFINYILYVQ